MICSARMIDVTAAMLAVAEPLQCSSHWRRASAIGSNDKDTLVKANRSAGRPERSSAPPAARRCPTIIGCIARRTCGSRVVAAIGQSVLVRVPLRLVSSADHGAVAANGRSPNGHRSLPGLDDDVRCEASSDLIAEADRAGDITLGDAAVSYLRQRKQTPGPRPM